MRYRLRFIYQFAVLAAVALLAVVGLGLFDLRDQAQTDAILREQEQLLELKRQLARMELEVLNARLAETQMLATRNVALYRDYALSIEQVEILVGQLQERLPEGELAHSLQLLGRTAQRYRNSVRKALEVQQKMGLGDEPGLLVQVRQSQEDIQRHLQALQVPQLFFILSRLLLVERDFSTSLDMKLADQLLAEAGNLRRSIAERQGVGNAAALDDLLRRYQEQVGELISGTVELELATAEKSLQFERISPSIARGQEEADALLAANAERLLLQRGDAFVRTVAIFTTALVLIAALMFLQIRSARQLASRLDLLAEGMGEIAAGQFIKVMDLPQGRDEVGQLGQTFKDMATQIQAQILTIQQERENAEIANRVKSQFLATMSHEIRTPLNAVLGMLELLENSELDAEQREYAVTSRRAAEGLMELLHGILDLSRIEAEKLELQQAPFSLQAVIGQTVSLFGPMAREKELHFAHFVDRKIPPRLVGDAGRIRQVLANLVGNAIKFTERGQVKLAIQQVDGDASYVELQGSVEDTGPGIPEEFQQKIFTPFVQVDSSITRQHGGSGLGLSICARLIDLMGGRIWVESKEGGGASFFFSLTLAVAVAEGGGSGAETDEIPANMAETMPLKILFVDDIESNLSVALQNFSLMGYEIDVAKNGFEAVERTQRSFYDLIFMDIQMPVMDGIEAAKIILNAAGIERRPRIIAVTGHSSQVNRQALDSAGMDDLLSKPFRLRELYAMVEKWGKANRAGSDGLT